MLKGKLIDTTFRENKREGIVQTENRIKEFFKLQVTDLQRVASSKKGKNYFVAEQ